MHKYDCPTLDREAERIGWTQCECELLYCGTDDGVPLLMIRHMGCHEAMRRMRAQQHRETVRDGP
jgi:hypothetical protein